MRIVLTIAGSDSSGGAGIQADLKTLAAHGVYGLSAITAVTAQNTQGVIASAPVPPGLVAAQIEAVAADFSVDATKIGMLATSAIAEEVAEAVARLGLKNVVLDPVLAATTGERLLDEAGLAVLRARLLPLASVVTPNIREAEALTGQSIRSIADSRRAAEQLRILGARAVIITGGHLAGPPTDLVYEAGTFTELAGERLDVRHTHGTGCTFSSALAARLALGDTLVTAARAAKAYVVLAIRRAPGLGHGSGPLGHF
jgi:hydroxymethylpyrimidine/phosphomethylpyrimidine kinase